MARLPLPDRIGTYLRATVGPSLVVTLFTGCGQDAHHLASIASKLGRQIALGSERVRETALGRLFQNRSVLGQVPLTDRARIRLRLDRSLQGLDITVRQIEPGCLELTGEVPDEAARQAAVQSVQQVPGVEKVADGLKLPGSGPNDGKSDSNAPDEATVPQPAPMPGGGLPPLPSAVENRPGPGSKPPAPGGGLGPAPGLPAPNGIPPAPAPSPVTIPPPPPPPKP